MTADARSTAASTPSLAAVLALALLALAMLLAGCAVGGHHAAGAGGHPGAAGTAPAGRQHASRQTHQTATVTAQIILPARTMAAGSSMTGYVLVQNTTGHALHTVGCNSLFEVQLSSRSYHPVIAWTTCVQRLTIPTGQSRYRITVMASHDQCTRSRQPHGLIRCLPNGGPPPLPAGTYQARLYQLGHLVQPAPPVTVQVTRPATP